MYCTRCGNQTGELDRFCSQCGNAAPRAASASAPPPAPQAPGFYPTLTRSLRNRKIAGVCGGIGRHFGVDPTVVRIVFLAAFLCPLPSIIPYIVCWALMPLERPEPLYAPPVSYPPMPTAQAFTPMAR